jgi:hypothetical protein
MNIALKSRLLALAGVLVFCAFTGDIVADSIADLGGDHCVSQTSQSDSDHEKTPCSHCSCAVHNGTVITSTVTVHINGPFQASVFFPAGEQSAPTGLPAAIDHPPQLA